MGELQSALACNSERQAYLRGEIGKIFNPPNRGYEAVMRHQEIRAFFRTMPRSQAINTVESAKKSNDEETLIALASVQPYLTGLPPEMHGYARNHLIQAYAAEEAKALEVMEEQVKIVKLFQSELAQSTADLIDFRKADEIIAAAQEDTAAA
jgi:hypothetical protein